MKFFPHLEMSIQWPQQKYDGTIPKTSAEDILKFIEDNAKLPKVEISGDDFLIYKLQNEFFQHLKSHSKCCKTKVSST